MATWRVDLQRWSWREGDTDPIRYCFVDKPEGAEHPARSWSEEEKSAARHAIEEWNAALKRFAVRHGRSGMDRIVEGEPCDITLRWEDDSFFRNYQVVDETSDPPRVDHGLDLTGTPGYADRVGGGSLEEIEGNSLTPFTPGRDTTKFPRGEAYFNVTPRASISNFAGWFIDPTPDEDNEFEEVDSDTIPPYRKLQARQGEPADNRIDFYTAVKHEFGHMLGLDHRGRAGANGDRGQVMAAGVGAQERRHQLPILKWMENERRHLRDPDVELLEELYADEFAQDRKRSAVVWIVAIIVVLIAVLVFVLS